LPKKKLFPLQLKTNACGEKGPKNGMDAPVQRLEAGTDARLLGFVVAGGRTDRHTEQSLNRDGFNHSIQNTPHQPSYLQHALPSTQALIFGRADCATEESALFHNSARIANPTQGVLSTKKFCQKMCTPRGGNFYQGCANCGAGRSEGMARFPLR